MKISLSTLVFILLFAVAGKAQNQTRFATNAISSLRVNDVGISFGPANDAIAAEVIVTLANTPNLTFGFQLRKDDQEIAHEGMLALLRDAYAANLQVKLTYQIANGMTKGKIVVVELNK